jgi:prepilin-type processing-associated H-X9-DG protein
LPGGANVLYMDGHVSFEKYPSDWPVSSMFAVVVGNFG